VEVVAVGAVDHGQDLGDGLQQQAQRLDVDAAFDADTGVVARRPNARKAKKFFTFTLF